MVRDSAITREQLRTHLRFLKEPYDDAAVDALMRTRGWAISRRLNLRLQEAEAAGTPVTQELRDQVLQALTPAPPATADTTPAQQVWRAKQRASSRRRAAGDPRITMPRSP